ncbi:MAG: hypothetical protein IT174_14555 [Acidobacteria bacterium]|nr:hypothetical protein [Acidobacteriota bacterium]
MSGITLLIATPKLPPDNAKFTTNLMAILRATRERKRLIISLPSQRKKLPKNRPLGSVKFIGSLPP